MIDEGDVLDYGLRLRERMLDLIGCGNGVNDLGLYKDVDFVDISDTLVIRIKRTGDVVVICAVIGRSYDLVGAAITIIHTERVATTVTVNAVKAVKYHSFAIDADICLIGEDKVVDRGPAKFQTDRGEWVVGVFLAEIITFPDLEITIVVGRFLFGIVEDFKEVINPVGDGITVFDTVNLIKNRQVVLVGLGYVVILDIRTESMIPARSFTLIQPKIPKQGGANFTV